MFSCGLMLSNFKGADSRLEGVMRQIQESHRQTLIQELRRVIQQKDAFMSSVSHELRTPLNGIIGESRQRDGQQLDGQITINTSCMLLLKANIICSPVIACLPIPVPAAGCKLCAQWESEYSRGCWQCHHFMYVLQLWW